MGSALTTYECGHVTGSEKEDLAGHLPVSSLPVSALIFEVILSLLVLVRTEVKI